MQNEVPYVAILRICPSNDREISLVEVIEKSLIAEAKNPASVGRIFIDISREGKCIAISMRADTLSHLRAVVNSFLYLVHGIVATVEAIEELK